MKFKMFSVLVGSEACIANCPFCVSREDPRPDNLVQCPINWRNLRIAANLANRSNVDTVMITSRGEPLLFPKQISEYLVHLKEFNFPFIELQTNGILLGKNKDKYDKYLREWYQNGLTTITISVVSHKRELNQKNYFQNKQDYIDLVELIDYLHELKFCVRLTCVCCKDTMDSREKVEEFIQFAKKHKVEQVTLRPVNDEYRRDSAHQWILKNKLTDKNKKDIMDYLEEKGTRLLVLDRIGTIYDVEGQNVLFSVPLTKYTRDTNPENLRNLIFFQDGHIRYEWEMEGGILL